ncbi:MAG: DUF167 domain-containing protein [Candidatus Omnitrophica bacterium]|nr:DUF167 domain-containing protein [Candidatus Omnitrophota bacterium]
MILSVRVVPKSSRLMVKQEHEELKAYLTKPAEDNLANEQLIVLLAGYLKVKKYQLRIIKGQKSRNKLVEFDENIRDTKRK